MDTVIETQNLTKYYPRLKSYREFLLHPFRRSYVPALNNVSLSVKRGSILGLLGLNGAGKTTLIKILSTLVHPSSGTAIVNGYNVVKQEKEVLRSIGLVTTDERSFYWRLTGMQNLHFFATLNNIPTHERTKKVNDALKQTELEKDGGRMFKDYSTGMKQRLAIARGLLCNPDILFLDEPTRSLDPHSSKLLRDFIKNRIIGESRRTAIIATHNLHEAEEICSHIAVIKNGSLIAQGTFDEVMEKEHSNYYILKLSSESSLIDINNSAYIQSAITMQDENNVFQIQTNNLSSALHDIIDMGAKIEECYPKKLSLEDIFSELIEKGKTGSNH